MEQCFVVEPGNCSVFARALFRDCSIERDRGAEGLTAMGGPIPTAEPARPARQAACQDWRWPLGLEFSAIFEAAG
jgi:hypothetical protein